MTFNYRVMRDSEGNCTIREVYYDDDGEILGWTEEPAAPFGEDEMELARDVSHFVRALALDVLDEEDLFEE